MIGKVATPVCSPRTLSCSIRRRAARVERRHQDLLAVTLLQAAGDLGGRGGFTRALEADHEDRHRRQGCKVERLAIGTEHRDEFVVDDLDDHLAGRDRLDDFLADRFFLHLVGEIADDFERNVGFEQRAADFAHRFRRRHCPSAHHGG